MKGIHILAALLVAAIWGSNFVAIKLSYETFTPFSLLVVRFCLSCFPLLFFVPKPHQSWKQISIFSLFFWIGQFSFTFSAVYMGLSGGLCALIMQSQVLFTAVLSYFFFGTRLGLQNLLGLAVSFSGILAIAFQVGGEGNLLAFILIICGAFSASIGNVLLKAHKYEKIFPLIVWSSLIPPLPLLGLGILLEGPYALIEACCSLTWTSVTSIFYTVYMSTLVATTLYGFLIRLYGPTAVTPFLLLTPLFGMLSCALVLGETMSVGNLIASFFVILGLGINQFAKPFKKKKTSSTDSQQSPS